MPNTTNGLPYPVLTDENNPPADIQALAEATDETYGRVVASATDLPVSGKFAGQRVWLTNAQGYAIWNGAAWTLDVRRRGFWSGSAAVGSSSRTITFSPAFPTGTTPLITGLSLRDGNVDWIQAPTASSVSNTGFTLAIGNKFSNPINVRVDYEAIAP